jgi:hypothetical protein
LVRITTITNTTTPINNATTTITTIPIINEHHIITVPNQQCNQQ